MAKFFLSEKAVEDLGSIWFYTVETWSENQADKYYSLLVNAFVKLAENPSKGRNYNLISEGLMGYKIGEHIIFYTVLSSQEIEIMRILHAIMDLKSKF